MTGRSLFFACFLGILLPMLLIAAGERYLRGLALEQPYTDDQPQQSGEITEPLIEAEDTLQQPGIQIPVLLGDGSVKEMELETYLMSVVLCEMPASFEMEALKAQAVVARTYALRQFENKSKHPTAAVCMDANCCQGYCTQDEFLKKGGNQQLLEKVSSAVNSTQSLVLVYNGALIDATYFSCSGGKTEDAVEVWGTDVPYLQSTDSPGEEIAEGYTQTVTFSKEEFLTLLGLSQVDQAERLIGAVSYTNGGGVESIEICGERYKGTYMRQKLGLRSTAFAICAVGNSVSVTTKGFGHRVGMSQYGAEAMAVKGSDFEEILKHYYKGVELVYYSCK